MKSGWTGKGYNDRRNLRRYVPKALEKGASILKKGHWKIENNNQWADSFMISASINIQSLYENKEDVIKALKDHIYEMKLL